MYDFESLVNEVLRNKPELTRENLIKRIEQKKSSVGAGYLTDQGALFLIAGELGVRLQRIQQTEMTLKDLHVGANDITVVARILSIYPVSTYKKKEGGEGKYRRLVLFEGERMVRLTLWEDRVGDVERLGVRPGSIVRITGGYVKQGLDGRPELGLGRRGSIEAVVDASIESKLPTLENVAKKIAGLDEGKNYVVLDCVISSEPKKTDFYRSDGSPGTMVQFRIRGDGTKKEYRVVIWNLPSVPQVSPGQRVMLTNLKTKRSGGGEIEIHGDAGSAVVLVRENGAVDLRVAATLNEKGQIFVVAADKRAGVLKVAPNQPLPNVGDPIRVLSKDPDGSRIQILRDEETSTPDLRSLITKISDLKDEGSPVVLEVIALSHGSLLDVPLKDGTVVKKGEILVGDDTGEIKAVAWRDLSSKVLGYEPGEKLRIVGALAKLSRMGAWTLMISDETIIEKLHPV